MINQINSIDLDIIIEQMQEFFTDEEHHQPQQPQIAHDQPFIHEEPTQPPTEQTYSNQYDFTYNQAEIAQPSFNYAQEDNENEFNDFEEDETTKRIREQEERIQNLLKEKSERQWEDKQKRKQEGARLLQEYVAKKEAQKIDRAQENIKKQAQLKEEYAKLNVEAGWKKVITNINVRQGEQKGSKDTNRMREAILHRREDDKR